jgi:hypothetical protein
MPLSAEDGPAGWRGFRMLPAKTRRTSMMLAEKTSAIAGFDGAVSRAPAS